MPASRFARENEIATIPTHRNWGCFRVNRPLPGRCSGGGAIRDALSSGYAGHQYQRLLSNWVLRGVPEPTRERRPGLALSHPCGIHRGLLHILDIRMGDMDGLYFGSVLDGRALYGGEPCGWARSGCGWGCPGAVSGIDITVCR
jgi:hypothetical protein